LRPIFVALSAYLAALPSLLDPFPASAASASARWTSIGPDSGADVRALAVDPRMAATLYVGTSHFTPIGPPGGSVYKSTDSGANWVLSGSGLPDRRVASIAVDPSSGSTLYAATPFGVFRSLDAAASWLPASTGLSNIGVEALAVDPSSPRTLYAAGLGGVFKSTDGAGSWTASNLGLQGLAVQALVIDPANPSNLYAATGTGVFRSPDAGASWSPAGDFPNASVISLAVARGSSVVYAGISNDLQVSSNLGATWHSSKSGLAPGLVRAIAASSSSTHIVYASVDTSTGSTVFRSADAGATWTETTGGPTSVATLAIGSSPATVYAGGIGVFRSADAGATWTEGHAGMREAAVNALATVSGRAALLYASTTRNVFRSGDRGTTWAASMSGLPNAAIQALAAVASSQILFAGSSVGVFRSLDGGATWTVAATGLDQAGILALALDPISPSTLYAGSDLTYIGFGIYTGGGVYKSSDLGANWTAGGLAGVAVACMAIDPSSPETIYAGTSLGVFRSADGGTVWTTGLGPLTGKNVRSLAVDPSQPGTLFAGTSDGSVFRSVDSAMTWTGSGAAFSGSSVQALAIDPRSSATIYAGTYSGVWRSRDAGATWAAINEGLTNLFVLSLALDRAAPTDLYAGTYGGSVFALPLTASPPRSSVRTVAPRR
jgi:hypothetical protein